MNTQPPAKAATAGAPARPAVEVRVDGVLIQRISEGAAGMLISRGWAEWRGAGNRRYLALTDRAPLSALPSLPGRDGTRVARAGGNGARQAGQVLGESKSHREHTPRTEWR
jgi:hypothetical protein